MDEKGKEGFRAYVEAEFEISRHEFQNYDYQQGETRSIRLANGATIDIELNTERAKYYDIRTLAQVSRNPSVDIRVDEPHHDKALNGRDDCPLCQNKNYKVLAAVRMSGRRYIIIPNLNPYTRNHLLFMKDIPVAQIATAPVVRDFMVALKAMGEGYEGCFNSPGAGASVYHLHFHLFKMTNNIWKYLDGLAAKGEAPYNGEALLGWVTEASFFENSRLNLFVNALRRKIRELIANNTAYNITFRIKDGKVYQAIIQPRKRESVEITTTV